MKIKPSFQIIAVLLGSLLASSAFAQTIAFNKNFMCNGERESVSSCRDDSDAAGCMVMYPDRPLHNGFTVQVVENRGDVIKKIKSCVGPGATLASTGNPAPAAPAPARGTSTSPAAAAAAPKANTPPPAPDPSVAKAKAAGVDMTALGLQLGQAYTVPMCNEVGLADAFSAILGNSKIPPQTYPCSQGAAGQTNKFGVTTDQGIEFAANQCPAWMSPCTASVMVKNGLLLGVYINTNGQTGDAAASTQLIAKYGKATQQQTLTFKNVYNYSAQFQKLIWTLPGLYVEYDPFITDINQGVVIIETETAHQIRVAAQQTQQANQPKL